MQSEAAVKIYEAGLKAAQEALDEATKPLHAEIERLKAEVRDRANQLEATLVIIHDHAGAEFDHDMTRDECKRFVRAIHAESTIERGQTALCHAWGRAETAEATVRGLEEVLKKRDAAIGDCNANLEQARTERYHAYAEYDTTKKALDNALRENVEWYDSYRRLSEDWGEQLKKRDELKRQIAFLEDAKKMVERERDKAISMIPPNLKSMPPNKAPMAWATAKHAGAMPADEPANEFWTAPNDRHPFIKWFEEAARAIDPLSAMGSGNQPRDPKMPQLAEAIARYVNDNPPPAPPPDPRQPGELQTDPKTRFPACMELRRCRQGTSSADLLKAAVTELIAALIDSKGRQRP